MSNEHPDLDAMEARASAAANGGAYVAERVAREDVPALVAEVRRLRALKHWRPLTADEEARENW